jgi:hypothetical protein
MITLLLLLDQVTAASEPGPVVADPHADVRADTQGTLRSIEAVAATVRGLSATDREDAAASLGALSVSDPFTRAALQLPFALNVVVAQIPPEAFEPAERAAWSSLQRGLATHVAALDALDVDLAVPRPGDPLYGADVPLLDREALLASDDPLGATAALIDAIIPLARGTDAPTRARVDAASDHVEAVTGLTRPCPRGPHAAVPGQPWTLGMQLGGWHDALQRAEPFAVDPAAEAKVQDMLAALAAYGEASSMSVYQLDRRP